MAALLILGGLTLMFGALIYDWYEGVHTDFTAGRFPCAQAPSAAIIIITLFRDGQVTFRSTLGSRVALQAEVLALRHQIFVLQRGNQKRRVKVSPADRLLWVWLSRLWPGWRAG